MSSAGDGITVDRESLRAMADALRTSTDKLADTATPMPAMPQVSTSADKVGHTLSEITKTVAGLVAGVEDTANRIDAGDGSYGKVDNANADHLQRRVGTLGPD